MELKDLIKEIKKDNTSGATALVQKAGEALALFLGEEKGLSYPQFLSNFLKLGRRLIQAQPSMAPIINLVNYLCLQIKGEEEIRKMRERLKEALSQYLLELKNKEKKIREKFYQIIKEGSPLMTYSYSSAVVNSLLQAKSRGKKFEVICSESRPALEGIKLTQELARAGIKVKLVIDSALFSFLREIQLVVVGADAVFMQGLVNKIGTLGLAFAAAYEKVPFYSLAGTEKFLSPSLEKFFKLERKNPQEVLRQGAENIEAINLYFDLIPLNLLKGVVTEKGIFSSREIGNYLKKLDSSPYLLKQALSCNSDSRP